jgi:hypothetical protein
LKQNVNDITINNEYNDNLNGKIFNIKIEINISRNKKMKYLQLII